MLRARLVNQYAESEVLAQYLKQISLSNQQYADLCKIINLFVGDALRNKTTHNKKIIASFKTTLSALDPLAMQYCLAATKEYLQSRDFYFKGKYISRSWLWGQITYTRESQLLRPLYQCIDQLMNELKCSNSSQQTALIPQASFIQILGDTIDSTCDYIVKNPRYAFIYFLYLQSYFVAAQPQTVRFKNIDAIDISSMKVPCTEKTKGTSSGKVCVIDEKKYYLKTAKPNSDKTLLEEHNLRFARNNIEVAAPQADFVHQDGTFYHASLEVEDFSPGTSLLCHDCSDAQFREKTASTIGETGIAKLAVANTFIKDLHAENWGYSGNQLVLIDVDNSPRTLEEHFKLAAEKLRLERHKDKNHHKFKHVLFPLSLNNLLEMKSIYEKMLTKSLGKFHEDVDLSYEVYTKTLNAYIKACTDTIDRLKKKHQAMDLSIPSYSVNKELANCIEGKTVAIKIQQEPHDPDPIAICPHENSQINFATMFQPHAPLLTCLPDEEITYWKDKLKKATSYPIYSIDKIDKTIQLGVIKDYNKFFSLLIRLAKLPPSFSSFGTGDDISEYLSLSGELNAIEYAIQHYQLEMDIAYNPGSKPILHLAALSGSLPAVEKILALKRSDPFIQSQTKETALHYAALSGSVELVTFLRQLGLNPEDRNFFRDDAFAFAEQSPNPEAVLQALKEPLQAAAENVKAGMRL